MQLRGSPSRSCGGRPRSDTHRGRAARAWRWTCDETGASRRGISKISGIKMQTTSEIQKIIHIIKYSRYTVVSLCIFKIPKYIKNLRIFQKTVELCCESFVWLFFLRVLKPFLFIFLWSSKNAEKTPWSLTSLKTRTPLR